MAESLSKLAQELKPYILQWIPATRAGGAAAGGGISDHGQLSGLGDDDHLQYFNMPRGDARYLTLASYAAHVANPDAHHLRAHDLDSVNDHTGTLSWAKVNKAGSDLAHLATRKYTDLTNRTHSITGGDHSITASQYQLVGATAVNTLGLLTPLADVSGATKEAVLKSDGNGYLTLVRATLSDRLRAPLIDTVSGDLTVSPAGSLVKLASGKGMRSASFASGFAGNGWQVDDGIISTGTNLEVDNLTVRNILRVYELLIQQIRATNGSIFVSSVAKIETVVDNGGGSYTLTVEGDANVYQPFAVNDLIRAQRVRLTDTNLIYRSDLQVTAINVGGDTRKFTATLRSGSSAPTKGMEFVRLGNTADASRRGALYLSSDDSGAPFLDVVDGIAAWTDWGAPGKIKTRVGKLTGITGVANEYGVIAGATGYADADSYFKASNLGLRLNNTDLRLYSGASLVVQMERDYGLSFLAHPNLYTELTRTVSWHTSMPGSSGNTILSIGGRSTVSEEGGGIASQATGSKVAATHLSAKHATSDIAWIKLISSNADLGGGVYSSIDLVGGRLRYSNNDTTYHTVWHAGNDGADSGIDTDYIRGIRPNAVSGLAAMDQYQLFATNSVRDGVTLGGSGWGNTSYVAFNCYKSTTRGANGEDWPTDDNVMRFLGPQYNNQTRPALLIWSANSNKLVFSVGPAGLTEGAGITGWPTAPYELEYDYAAAALRVRGNAVWHAGNLSDGSWANASFNPGWANYGSPYRNVQYRKLAFGSVVIISGLVKATSTTPGIAIFILPSGYRPGTQLICSCMSYLPSTGTNEARRVDVYTNGEVRPVGWTPELNTWISLEIMFSL